MQDPAHDVTEVMTCLMTDYTKLFTPFKRSYWLRLRVREKIAFAWENVTSTAPGFSYVISANEHASSAFWEAMFNDF